MQLLNSLGYVDWSVFSYFDGLVKKKNDKSDESLKVIAECIRYNTLLSVARAGTGHLGASLSCIEILTEIYFRSFSFFSDSNNSSDRDIFILSKGHAAPALYATLAAKGYIPTNELDFLRRLNHLEGHCDIKTPGIEANTGSLAMGLSKAVGYAIAKKRFGLKGNVIVIVGDGELQEGQCWEAFLSAASYRLDNLYVVVDDNKVQTDKLTRDILTYGKLIASLKELGFTTIEGNDKDVGKVFERLKKGIGKPKLFWCMTKKGQGVDYMEHTNVLKTPEDKYIWHNKAPNADQLKMALDQIIARIKIPLRSAGFEWDMGVSLVNIPKERMQTGIEGDNLLTGLSKALVEEGEKNNKIVVLDGDLEEDCGFIPFHTAFPNRFFEMGIMEQHMVSTAAALSKSGYIPIISTYAAFLTARANEQLYNFSSECLQGIIIGNMAGVLPATPGKSHQGFRDIACMKSIPEVLLYQPVNAQDTETILARYFRNELGRLLYIRLSMATSIIPLPTPPGDLRIGCAHKIKDGNSLLVIGIGPVVLGECLKAAGDVEIQNISVEVWNHPWLTQFDKSMYKDAARRGLPLLIVEDHFHRGGFGESLLAFLQKEKISFPKIEHIALKSFPQTGFRDEALMHFGLHRKLIAAEITKLVQ